MTYKEHKDRSNRKVHCVTVICIFQKSLSSWAPIHFKYLLNYLGTIEDRRTTNMYKNGCGEGGGGEGYSHKN